MTDQTDRTAMGADPNVAGALCYALGWITGVLILAVESTSHFVRFHAWQSTIVFGTLSVAWFLCLSIPFVGWLISLMILPPLSAVLWLLLMFKAYQGERYRLPFAGDLAAHRE